MPQVPHRKTIVLHAMCRSQFLSPYTSTQRSFALHPMLFSSTALSTTTAQKTRQCQHKVSNRLTVRLLVSGTRTWTTELLWLHSPVVGNEQCAVVLGECLLDLVLCVLVHVLLVVGDDGLCDSLADGVDLRSVTTTGDADADVNAGELVEAN